MAEIITLLTVGVALSMDAFSISLSIGTLDLPNKKQNLLALIVGIFHFFMPLFGLFFGKSLLKLIHLNPHVLLSCVLILIAFGMIREIISKEEKHFNLSILGILGFAFSVSFDSFSTGIGLITITNKIFLAATIFSISSFIFTSLGLNIGKYSKHKWGIIANVIGAILLIIIAIIQLFM